MFRRWTAASLFFAASVVLRAQTPACVGGVAVTTFRLSASPATATRTWMPVRQINNLPSNYRVRYQPGALPPDIGKEAAVALVLVPKSGDGEMRVLPPAPITGSTEWVVPFDTGIVLLVFAPQGFDEKRLTNLVTRDPELISALAEYAQQTQDLEDTLDALRHLDGDAEAAMDDGHATTPTEQALLALLKALNPAVSTYDPLGSGRRAGPTSMMGRGASMFFENAGGAFPGSGALPSVKQFLMPDTEFRSVYGVGADSGSMTLCAQRQGKTRNKLAYIWAYPLTNATAPTVQIAASDVAVGMYGHARVKAPKGINWDLMQRFTDWGLVSPSGGAPLHIEVRPSTTARELILDLRDFKGLPATYGLEARWDWATVRFDGAIRVRRLGDLSKATVAPESSNAFAANSGWVPLEVTGADAPFLERASIQREGSVHETPLELPALRDKLRIEVNTDGLRPGVYALNLTRVDGAVASIPLRLLRLPIAPQIAGAVRPKIVESKAGFPVDLAVTMREGELPSGSFVSFSLKIDPADLQPTLTLGCVGAEQRTPQNYSKTGPGTLFFSLDPGSIGACALTAMIETADRGASDAFPLGNVVRVPRIDKLTLTNDSAQGGYAAILEGWNLDSIERTGWSATAGLVATDIPRPIAGEGAKQTLRIAVPWPSPAPKAPLYIWLRGEQQGRATRIAP